MLLNAAHTSIELADQNAMADDRAVILSDGVTQPGDLIADILAEKRDIGGDVGAQRVNLGL